MIAFVTSAFPEIAARTNPHAAPTTSAAKRALPRISVHFFPILASCHSRPAPSSYLYNSLVERPGMGTLQHGPEGFDGVRVCHVPDVLRDGMRDRFVVEE